MSKVVNKCLGCGVELQTTDPNALGYTNNLASKYCLACYQLKHYGIASSHFHPVQLPDFESNAMVVLIVSVLFLDTLFAASLNRLISHKLIIIVNQIDLLPQSTNLDNLLANLTQRLKDNKINVHEVILMSAKNKHDLANLKGYLLEYVTNKIYLVGIQNSGKTTIFKALTNNDNALSMAKAALTQEILAAKMNEKTILDTPGLYQSGYLHDLLPYREYKKVLPNKTIKPIIYKLKNNDSLIINGLAGITVTKIENSSVVCYFRQTLKIHKTTSKRVSELLSNAKNRFGLGFDKYQTLTYRLTKALKYQITLADFGFIHLMGPAVIQVQVPPKMHVSLMEALFK